jgi:hypothetical protein
MPRDADNDAPHVKFSFRKLNFTRRNGNSCSRNRASRAPRCARNTRNRARSLPQCNFMRRKRSSGYPWMKFRRPLRESRHPELRATFRKRRFTRRNCAYLELNRIGSAWKRASRARVDDGTTDY